MKQKAIQILFSMLPLLLLSHVAYGQERANQDSLVWIAAFVPVILLVVFPLFWCTIVFLISFLTGWRKLSREYATTQSEPANAFYTSASMGMSRYKGVLKVGVHPEGLWLSVMPLFRIGHPNMIIPWSEISKEHRKIWQATFVVVMIHSVTIQFRESVWTRVQAPI